VGDAHADTGHNTAIGNNSVNDAHSFQDAHATDPFGGFGGVGDDATAANDVHNLNASDGHAGIATGDAHAVGNDVHDVIDQVEHDIGHDIGHP
jgi:hypothetical protein